MKYLAETCLLTHGLRSIDEAALQSAWPFPEARLAWVDRGELKTGTLQEYLPFRLRRSEYGRIDCDTLEKALQSGMSGALTASGTMAACRLLGVPLAVTCGMGGIGDIVGEELCPDLPALARIPVALIATAPKDMLDIPATFRWLREHGVHVAGPECTGSIFESAHYLPEERPKAYMTEEAIRRGAEAGGRLLLNPIPAEQRIRDRGILESAVRYGKEKEKEGLIFHPAVNGEIDRLTDGYSSRIQLLSFIENIRLAMAI